MQVRAVRPTRRLFIQGAISLLVSPDVAVTEVPQVSDVLTLAAVRALKSRDVVQSRYLYLYANALYGKRSERVFLIKPENLHL